MRSGSAFKAWLVAAVCLFAVGCASHKAPRAVMPTIVSLPVEILDVPEPALPRIAPVPAPSIKVPTASRVARDVRRIGRRPGAPALAAGTPAGSVVIPASSTAPTPTSDEAVIGSLTTGDDSASTKQSAGAAITDLEKRLAGLSPDVARTRQTQILQVRDFVKKAREALDSGDASGAVTLATKARLLLDDSLK